MAQRGNGRCVAFEEQQLQCIPVEIPRARVSTRVHAPVAAEVRDAVGARVLGEVVLAAQGAAQAGRRAAHHAVVPLVAIESKA